MSDNNTKLAKEISPTSDVHIRMLDPIPTPAEFLEKFPLTDANREIVMKARTEIHDVLTGADDRLLVLVGPCSVHDIVAVGEYTEKLAAKSKELNKDLLIVMRTYFEKPRTTIGWKGLINDPDINDTFNITKGIGLARQVMKKALDLDLPVATEFLDPITPQYISDAVSWGAIGARNPESQVHRQLVSGLSMPVGFKNSTSGRLKAAIDGCVTAFRQHSFLSINFQGQVIAAQTTGNPDCHVILRGNDDGPNYDAATIQETLKLAQKSYVSDACTNGVVVDAAHGNSGKNVAREIEVLRELATRISKNENGITGVMFESFLERGNQTAAPLEELKYGCSITDPCVDWDSSSELLDELADAVRLRRIEKFKKEGEYHSGADHIAIPDNN
jgi:3-deoxy-7-phosphoheptulonate synthase